MVINIANFGIKRVNYYDILIIINITISLLFIKIVYFYFRISNLVRCQIDPLIEFVPVVLDKLLSLLVESPVTQHQQPMNLGQTIFRTLADLVSMTMVV